MAIELGIVLYRVTQFKLCPCLKMCIFTTNVFGGPRLKIVNKQLKDENKLRPRK